MLQQKLAVASNNIANSNTTSFKRSEAKFGDIFASSVSTKASTAFGSGVALKGVAQQFSQGGLQLSENVLDLAITGMVFSRWHQQMAVRCTRNGSFMLNEDNQIVNDFDYMVQVHPLNLDGTSDFNQAMIPLVVERNLTEASTEVSINTKIFDGSTLIGPGDGSIAIDPTDPTTYNSSQTLSLFDDAGEPYTVTVFYQKIAEGVAQDDYRVAMYTDVTAAPTNTFNVSFDANGAAIGAIPDQVIAASPVDGRTEDLTISFNLQTTQNRSK